ncbi:MAG: EutN/CcmL family microcompartment protein [Planctomycetales bacterium]|nr:EutN/CcmL family microcompartment protein [Planctomycetales bacterium]
MRIAKVIGNVTLSRSHPSYQGASLKVVVPQSWSNLTSSDISESDTIVAWDELGAGRGDLIALSEGAEAAQPFRPDSKPVDAYNAAILDHIHIKHD